MELAAGNRTPDFRVEMELLGIEPQTLGGDVLKKNATAGNRSTKSFPPGIPDFRPAEIRRKPGGNTAVINTKIVQDELTQTNHGIGGLVVRARGH